LHFEFPEKNLQYYPDFLSTESSYLPIVGSRLQPTKAARQKAAAASGIAA
jgi:hypothetical protein